MSHNVTISGVKITDINILRKAIEELNKEGCNLTLVGLDEKGDKPLARGWGKRKFTYDYVVRDDDSKFDIGLTARKNTNGSTFYEITVEDMYFNPKISIRSTAYSHEQQALARFTMMYSACVAEKQARFQGYSVHREFDQSSGKYLLTINA